MLPIIALCQQESSFKITGKIIDKEYKNALNATTISVYDAELSVISFQIANTYGDFNFNIAKIKFPVKVTFSNIGYELRTIIYEKPQPDIIKLGNVELIQKDVSIEEVEIRLAPVTLNGDTLEFNPQAFKLDSTAVLDDFLRKIPNVTIWGDGQITVNGKEIKSLMVNGKPFFGNDFKIALGNLPKDAIQKVQVYRQEEQKGNTLDSLLEMNVKLKAGMDHGYFGKFSVGSGTDSRYDFLGNLNYFTKRMQIALTSTYNNINKIADNNKDLIAFSTYKASALEGNYQSNFMLPNENKAFSTGITFNYNFLERANPNLSNQLSADFFRKRLNVEEYKRSVTLNSLSELAVNSEEGQVNREGLGDETQFSIGYIYNNRINNLRLNANRFESRNENHQVLLTTVKRENGTIMSSYSGNTESNLTKKGYNASISYSYSPVLNALSSKSSFIPFDIDYSINTVQTTGPGAIITSFISYIDSSKNVDFDRKTERNNHFNQQKIHFILPDVFNALKLHLLPLSISLKATYKNKTEKKDEFTFENSGGKYQILDYLTNKSKEILNTFEYGVDFSKNYQKRLTDQFERTFNISFEPQFLNMGYNVVSQNILQNMRRNNHYFVPKGSIRFANNIFGNTKYALSSSFNTVVNFPDLNQLMPLIDSSQVYDLRIGNKYLAAEKISSIQLKYTRDYFKTQNTLGFTIQFGHDYSQNKIIDSISIAVDNRQNISLINVGGYKNSYIDGQIKKALKFKSSNLQLSLNGNLSKRILPSFINGNFVINRQSIVNIFASLSYSWNDLFSAEFYESAFIYETKQPYFNSIFKGSTYQHTLRLGYRPFKNSIVSSDVNFYTQNTGGLPSNKFTILNFNISQRILKQRNLELKLTAQDLLKQNRNVVNIIGVNRFVTRYQNSLQNYFLISMSYFPRKFGN